MTGIKATLSGLFFSLALAFAAPASAQYVTGPLGAGTPVPTIDNSGVYTPATVRALNGIPAVAVQGYAPNAYYDGDNGNYRRNHRRNRRNRRDRRRGSIVRSLLR